MPLRLLGTLAAAGAAITLAIVLLSGSHGRVNVGGLDPVAQAADTTSQAGSAEFGIAGSISAAGQTVPLSGNGALDMRARRMRMSMSMPVPGFGSMDVEEIFDGSTFYMRLPAQLVQRIPGGKQWMKLDLETLGKSSGIDFKQLMQSNQSNPGDMLQALKAVGGSKKVGEENIGGASTTHYTATIDVNKIAEKVADKQTVDSLRQISQQTGLSSLPIDVWIDRSGRVRQEQLKMSATGFSMNMTITFTRFGVSVDTTPPPADQVMDAASLMAAAGNSTSYTDSVVPATTAPPASSAPYGG